MCGRYTLRDPRGHRWLAEVPDDLGAPRYNIAPSQRVLVAGTDADGARRVAGARWGFRPRWLDSDRRAPINARAESAADKPMFRGAFRRGRCLVPADGWYEWQARPRGPKQPWFFHRPDDGVFFFAGLAATDAEGERTMAILTTDANGVAAPIHGRMPVVLADDAAASAWLDPNAAESTLRDLLAPAADGDTEAWPVGRVVNRPDNDRPEVVRPVEPDDTDESGQPSSR
jgi:putative SOS response-associated peptidase YedK